MTRACTHRGVAVALGVSVGLAVLLAGECGGGRTPAPHSPQLAPEPPRPNLILVAIDTLRADHLSHYDYHRPTAVALDWFRDQSTLFTRAYATAPWTGPSAASLLTGLLPARHGVNAHGSKVGAAAVTLAEILRRRGWATVGVSFNAEVSRKTGFDQGFEYFDDHLGRVFAYPDIDDMVDRVEDWLGAREAVASLTRKPFFLYLQPMNTHGPYRVPEEYASVLLGHRPDERFRYYGPLMKAIMRQGALDRRRDVDADTLQSLTDQYDTAIRYTTDKLAAIFRLLEAHGVYDGSLIIVTADHGEELFEHGGFSHGSSLHREVLHVPLYIKLPFQRRARSESARVSLADVYPTALDVLGVTLDHEVDGESLLSLLETDGRAGSASAGGGLDAERPLLFQSSWKKMFLGRAMVEGRYKLIAVESSYEGLENATRLYDIARDPEETRDLSEARPELVRQLAEAMQERFAGYRARALEAGENVLDQMDAERLEALGYLDPP
jgi:arylsulfatase A-like enzyme